MAETLRDPALGLAVRFVRQWTPSLDRSWVSRWDCCIVGRRVLNISWGYWFYADPLAKLADREISWLR